MTINSILLFALVGCSLFVIGLHIEKWTRPQGSCDPDLNTVDDEGLFDGWDGLIPNERRQRLAVYQRRVQARIAEQERAWLQQRLRECAKG